MSARQPLGTDGQWTRHRVAARSTLKPGTLSIGLAANGSAAFATSTQPCPANTRRPSASSVVSCSTPSASLIAGAGTPASGEPLMGGCMPSPTSVTRRARGGTARTILPVMY